MKKGRRKKGLCPQMTHMDADGEFLFFISALICDLRAIRDSAAAGRAVLFAANPQSAIRNPQLPGRSRPRPVAAGPFFSCHHAPNNSG
jgi:hypothetical protein